MIKKEKNNNSGKGKVITIDGIDFNDDSEFRGIDPSVKRTIITKDNNLGVPVYFIE